MSAIEDTWIQFDEFKGGIAVSCALCGRKITRQLFHASNLNYAEMHRLAVAYRSTHRLSDMHAAALAAYHSDDVPELSQEELLLASIFSETLPTETDRRRDAAKSAARKVAAL